MNIARENLLSYTHISKMYQKFTIQTKNEIKPQITAHLAQAMTLLGMGNDEVEEEIQKNLAKNPALESDEINHCAICGCEIGFGELCKKCLHDQLNHDAQYLTFVSTKEFTLTEGNSEDDTYFEDGTMERQTLPEYVLRQVGMEFDDKEKMVAATILTQLDDDGFADVDVLELASYFHIPIEKVEKVRRSIQHADPIGVGAKDAQEAMLVQIDELRKIKRIPQWTEEIIGQNYYLLMKKQFSELAQKYQISIDQVEKIANFVTNNLNPFPARSNWGDVRNPQKNSDLLSLNEADIILSFLDNDPKQPIVVEIIQPAHSNLILNANYHAALKTVDNDTKMKMRADLEKASLFIKCLHQRTLTIMRLAQTLVEIQERFIREGDRYLKPITRAEIAKKLGVHESTISRAVSSKTVQLPNRRIYPLSVFFDKSLQIRTEIKEIVEKEQKPLSDQEIVKKLEKRGVRVARRTVAKYRDMEGILPAFQRKEQVKE